tara:strand:+ start:1129 stop:2982 length:1854 start_codon:yes stop_codon:yes gene_type:complete
MADIGENKVSPQEIYDYLMTKPGMTDVKAKGILANIKAESAFYSDAVETGETENPGIGLFQHTFPVRKQAFIEAVPDWKTNWKGQIDFALQEQEAQKYMNTDFTNVSDSTRAFMLDFEKPADQSDEAINKRIEGFNNIELNTERETPSAPQPPVLDSEGNVVYQPTPEEGDQALIEEQERIRDAEEKEKQIIAQKRYNDALEYQELKERNKRLRAGYKPKDMPRVFANEIVSNEERISEIEKEYNINQITDEEYEARRLEAVASIITFDDALNDESEEEIVRSLVGSDLIEDTVEIGEEEVVESLEEQDNTTIPTLPTSEIPDDADIRQGVATWEDDDGNVQQARVGEIDEVEQPVITTETTETDETIETTETDETVNINNTTNQPKNFLDTFGELGNAIGNTLGLVDSIRQGVQSQDDLILAALGKQAYAEANKKIKPLELPGLSNLFRSHLEQSRQLAKKGFSPDEAQKAQAEIDAAYGKGIENAVRGTAGDRAKFLAMSGVLDSQRQSALLDFAAKDAELQRANNANYLKALSFHEEYELNKGKAEQSTALELALQEKKGASEFAKEVFKQIEQNRRDRALEPIQQYYISKLNNSMQNPYTSPLTTPSITDNNG